MDDRRISVLLSVSVLSAATLLYEITLMRLFSVAQFYHFAFMIISLAMLGYGASGTWLALWPERLERPGSGSVGWSLGFGIAAGLGYVVMNWLPFDSFSIAWDRRQIGILALHYGLLSLPFFCNGMVVGRLFARPSAHIGLLYAVNLAGSALGCLIAPFVPIALGGEGGVWLSVTLGGVGTLLLLQAHPAQRRHPGAVQRVVRMLSVTLVLVGAWLSLASPELLALRISPYKGLSYALQVPQARVVLRAWSGLSRVDLVASPSIRSLPGLSYRYSGPLPRQRGIFVDADDLSPVLEVPWSVRTGGSADGLEALGYLPTAVAYRLRSGGRALILEPRGGLEIWAALWNGASTVWAVEADPLVVRAADGIYEAPGVHTVVEMPRTYLARTEETYDVITLALARPYHPIRSGAYSLSEDYVYTVETLIDALAHLNDGGLLVLSRWLQRPPSESLRALALVATALESVGEDPGCQIVAFRGYRVMTFLVKNAPFTADELRIVREFIDARAFDLVYAPDIKGTEVNRHNVLESPIYYELFTDLIHTEDRERWYRRYPYDVRPPTDDWPFFGHYFKWSQATQVLAELGRTWQPFGGAGYFVLLTMLGFGVVAALGLVSLPVLLARTRTLLRLRDVTPHMTSTVAYFGLLGLAYLLVEVPLIQRFVLFLGQPALAMPTVLFALLLSSGVGSMVSHRQNLQLWKRMAVLALLIGLYAWAMPVFLRALLGLPLVIRLILSVALVAPMGFLMGQPFPVGLQRVQKMSRAAVPWAWAVNGAMSVVASILAAVLGLSFGFSWVLLLGGVSYGGIALLCRGWCNATVRSRL